MILATSALIADIPEEKPAMPAGGGGMGMDMSMGQVLAARGHQCRVQSVSKADPAEVAQADHINICRSGGLHVRRASCRLFCV